MNKIIVFSYILIAIIVFFRFFYLSIKEYKKEDPCYSFTDWYFDEELLLLHAFCSIFCGIVIPFKLIIWFFVKICKLIMKKCGVE